MTVWMIPQLVYSHNLKEPLKHQHKDQQLHDRQAKLLKAEIQAPYLSPLFLDG